MSAVSAVLDQLGSEWTSLSGDLRAELVSRYRITVGELVQLRGEINRWGQEPNNRMTAEERAAELRSLVVGFMRARRSECGACGGVITGAPYASVVDEEGTTVGICGEACIEKYSDLVMRRNLCEGCGSPTEPTDRAPTAAGGVRCASCSLKLTHAYGLELSSLMNARGLSTVRGGRAS